ncbi:MAG: hypothetical protein P1P86_04290 [Bacteroidales bacterium]|nr:hypothetical protein [Bacteroidales bacterium]
MKKLNLNFVLAVMALSTGSCTFKEMNFDHFPSLTISNEKVEMKIYLPDPENGLYRATRFDWSGIIGSVKYQGHEYFGYWKETHDPLFHEDLTGPVEGYIKAGLGYDEAEPGGKYVRIGVGVIEKPDEESYNFRNFYNLLDSGKWTVEHGADWISFRHELISDIGYSYVYHKIIRLKSNGFSMEHRLQNTGTKGIETDQFNHNFFMIDGEPSGRAFSISFPYPVSTSDDALGFAEIRENELRFIRDLKGDDSFFLLLEGYGDELSDHQVTVQNHKSGAGVTFTVDKPLHRMAFWACRTTLSPENSVWLSVKPGDTEEWKSEYTLFVK